MYPFKSGAVMAKGIEQRVRDFEKYYFNSGQIGKGGMATVHKWMFNPYVYYGEILDDSQYRSAAESFEKEMSDDQRNEVYADAKKDAQQSNDKRLIGLLEKKIIAVKELQFTSDEIGDRIDKEKAFMVNPSYRHPNIVEGYGWIEPTNPEDKMKILMEYVDAMPLDNVKGKMPVPMSVYICEKIATALEFCHKNEILHRDIKPLNFLVEFSKESETITKVKLTDFGLVKSLDSEVASHTLAGELLGTPKFYAPECVEDITYYDERSEVFALGASLYDLLCGLSPLQSMMRGADTNAVSMLVKLREVPDFVFAREYRPQVSKPLENIVMMAVAKNPEERPTMSEFKWHLGQLLKGRLSEHREHTSDEVTKRISHVSKLYSQVQKNPTAINYWTLANSLFQLQGKDKESIDALSNALELFKKLPENHHHYGYISLCEKLIAVEKRRQVAPHRKTD